MFVFFEKNADADERRRAAARFFFSPPVGMEFISSGFTRLPIFSALC
jgi:hypothetical protein